jgi:sugar diacid utilization regulator
VLVDPDDDAARQVVDHLGARCLPVRRGSLYGAIVPEPRTPRERDDLVRMLRGARAAVGHGVPLDRLPRAGEVARVLAELRRTEQVTGDPVFADDHLDTIIVARDPGLLEALRSQVLAPLADLPDGARERLTETLASWLRHLGDRHAMAEDLSIHPQTVRYRMAQLHERYGDRLDSPRERARLFLALTWAGPRHH